MNSRLSRNLRQVSKILALTFITMAAAVWPAVGCTAPPAAPPPAPTATPTEPAPTSTLLPTAVIPSAATETPTVPSPTMTPTGTPTPLAGGAVLTPTPSPVSRCPGQTGELEVQVTAGPAEAAGLDPVAVGSVPFTVGTNGPPYPVQGGGAISYADVLVEEWGTYAVDLDLDSSLSGSCTGTAGAEQLDLFVTMSGNQLVKIEGIFQAEYPWAGTNNFQISLPLVDGATAHGEGWSFVLQLPES